MPEELDSLLKKIQQDGLARADAETDKLISNARQKAADIVAEAEKQAAQKLQQAETDAEIFTARAQTAIQQAARDVILTVGDALTDALRRIVLADVEQALDGAALEEMLVVAARAYAQDDGGAVLVGASHEERIRQIFASRLTQEAEAGLEVKADGSVISGFRVSLNDGTVEHDFSAEALTDAICKILRPQIADIVREASSKTA